MVKPIILILVIGLAIVSSGTGSKDVTSAFKAIPENKNKKVKLYREKGMLQYFYHSPSSELPIRDVLNEQNHGYKTEPHIEIGAENYLIDCYQKNIISFLRNNEKYLFLLTSCKNRKLNKYYGKQFIVGYIERADIIDRVGFKCVKGETKLFSFEDSINVKEMFGYNYDRSKLVSKAHIDEIKTLQILKHFSIKRNILQNCVREIMNLDNRNENKKDKTCLVLRGGHCDFQKNGCLRSSAQ